MNRYIDAEMLIERWNNMSVRGRTEFDQEIMVAPSIDIIRCKECKYYNGNEEYCSVDHYATENGFCSYGEREDN